MNLFKQRKAELDKTGCGEAANSVQTAVKIKLRGNLSNASNPRTIELKFGEQTYGQQSCKTANW